MKSLERICAIQDAKSKRHYKIPGALVVLLLAISTLVVLATFPHINSNASEI
ncbi:MAG TPA: hypothetical protein VF043_09420 [Ktedonobacteraceae bacterium]